MFSEVKDGLVVVTMTPYEARHIGALLDTPGAEAAVHSDIGRQGRRLREMAEETGTADVYP